jgi:hypothetical protein
VLLLFGLVVVELVDEFVVSVALPFASVDL